MENKNKNNLQTLRKKKGYKQIKVALDLNTTQETISSYETGRVFPYIDMLIKLADYYNTSIDYILCRTKYDMPIDDIKPNNISDEDFILLNKINKFLMFNFVWCYFWIGYFNFHKVHFLLLLHLFFLVLIIHIFFLQRLDRQSFC